VGDLRAADKQTLSTNPSPGSSLPQNLAPGRCIVPRSKDERAGAPVRWEADMVTSG